MTPQAILKARFSELAESLGVKLVTRRQGGNYYFTVTGDWQANHLFMQQTFPASWMTSAASDEVVYGLPIADVDRVLARLHVDPAWLTHNNSAALLLARAVRADGAFDALPVLADALQEAGCENAEILTHCRGNAAHKHTCWVVELLLGPNRKRPPASRPT